MSKTIEVITVLLGIVGLGFGVRIGWSIAGHLLYRLGVRDVCGQTTINIHSDAVTVNSEERAA